MSIVTNDVEAKNESDPEKFAADYLIFAMVTKSCCVRFAGCMVHPDEVPDRLLRVVGIRWHPVVSSADDAGVDIAKYSTIKGLR